MPIQVLIAPPASGKTQFCIQQIHQVQAHDRLAPVWVLVPDRWQAAEFRRRLAIPGVAANVRVQTFANLYQEILEKAGQFHPVVSDQVIHQIVRAAIEETHALQPLQYYNSLAGMPGFTRLIQDLIFELKRSSLDLATFAARSSGLGSGLEELARLYRHYQDRLEALGWEELQGLGLKAMQAAEDHPGLLDGWMELLVVDGFDLFNPTQRRALGLLGQHVPRLLITLPGSPEMANGSPARQAHRRFQQTLEVLEADIPELMLVRDTLEPCKPWPLAELEAKLFELDCEPVSPPATLHMIEARSPAEEAREALRWMKRLILENQAQPGECLLVVPGLDPYRPLVQAAAREFGLKVFFPQTQPLSGSPAGAALLGLLDLILSDFNAAKLCEIIRSPFFDLSKFNLKPYQAGILEAVRRFGQVVGGWDQWQEVFAAIGKFQLAEDGCTVEKPGGEESPGEDLESEDLEEATRDFKLLSPPAARTLYQSLVDFRKKIKQPEGAKTRPAWVAWLESLLDELKFCASCENEAEFAAAQAIRETLNALALCERILPNETIPFAQFALELKGLVEGAGFRDETKPSADTILALRAVEARAGLRFKAVAMMGLAEGVFPEPEREDPLIGEATRRRLGMDPAVGRHQEGLFYLLFCRSDHYFLATRPYMAPDGEEWKPSPYWLALARLFGDGASPVQRISAQVKRPLSEAASPDELLVWAARQAPGFKYDLPQACAGDLQARWESSRRAYGSLKSRLNARLDEQAYQISGEAVQKIQEQYSPDYVWSASRLESYTSCPYLFFAHSLLNLRAEDSPQMGLNIAQKGSLLHQILESLYKRARESGEKHPHWHQPDKLLDYLREAASEVFKNAPNELKFRPSPVWEKVQAEIISQVEKNIRALEAGDGWEPIAFEAGFGDDEQHELAVEVDGKKIRFHGVIDRVDCNGNGKIRIIDYKSTGTDLENKDLDAGRRIQLPIYALAAEQSLTLGEPEEGYYWVLSTAEASQMKLSKYKAGDQQGLQAAVQTALERVGTIVGQIQAGIFVPAPYEYKCPPYCAIRTWCWHYEYER